MSRNLLVPLAVVAALVLAGCGGGSSSSSDQSSAQQSNNPHPIAGNFKPDDRGLSDCNGDSACVEQAFGNISYNDSPKAALKLVEEKMHTDGAVQGDCHRIVHMIGSAALARYNGNVGRAFSEGDSTCWSGYYHGILERSFYGATSVRELSDRARGVCEDPGVRRTTWLAYQCVHGLGHGLMLYTRYDLPGALGLCHGLTSSYDQISCTGGVFMENQQSSYGLKSKWLRDDNLLYPCTMVARADKQYCYLLVTSQILPKVGYDWRKTAEWCRRSDEGFVPICFQSFGRDASGVARQEPEGILVTCAMAGDGERECLYGAARDILNNDADDLRGRKLCESVEPEHRSYCFFGLGTILGAVHSTAADKRRACGRFAGRRDLRDCLEGAGALAS